MTLKTAGRSFAPQANRGRTTASDSKRAEHSRQDGSVTTAVPPHRFAHDRTELAKGDAPAPLSLDSQDGRKERWTRSPWHGARPPAEGRPQSNSMRRVDVGAFRPGRNARRLLLACKHVTPFVVQLYQERGRVHGVGVRGNNVIRCRHGFAACRRPAISSYRISTHRSTASLDMLWSCAAAAHGSCLPARASREHSSPAGGTLAVALTVLRDQSED